jgi:26S proteasome regulatory subunit N7
MSSKEVEIDDTPEEDLPQSPILKIANYLHVLGLEERYCSAQQKAEAKEALLAEIKLSHMSGFYEHACSTLGWEVDTTLLASMKATNEADLKAIDAKEAEAKENAGETEVRDQQLARANLYNLIGDRKNALEAFETMFESAVGAGNKIDLLFAQIRLALAWDDLPLLKAKLIPARNLVENGGDWDRRNRLAVYDATYQMRTRHFKEAANLLLEAVATFTTTELYNYNQFVFYTAVCSMVSLDRVTIREKLCRSPEILAVVDEIPELRQFIFSMYRCQYRQFFQATVNLTPYIKRDRFLSSHLGLIVRQLRVVIYSQFLTSYQTVTMASMAAAFGVSLEFLDREVSRFIAAGRLTCKIDKVSGLIETIRPDAKNAQYHDMLKHGDALLNQIQKLSKSVHFV